MSARLWRESRLRSPRGRFEAFVEIRHEAACADDVDQIIRQRFNRALLAGAEVFDLSGTGIDAELLARRDSGMIGKKQAGHAEIQRVSIEDARKGVGEYRSNLQGG